MAAPQAFPVAAPERLRLVPLRPPHLPKNASMSKIDIRHISKAFTTGAKQVLALADINLEVQANEFVALVGASGCGKSTLLRIVGGLELQTAGEVLIDGRLVYGPGTDRAMIF